MKNWPFALWGGDGENEGEGEGEGEGGSDEGEGSDEDKPVTMTQSQLESTIARAVSRATRKSGKSRLKDLGFESQDDLTAFVASTREAETANQGEAEKAAAALTEGEAELASGRTSLDSDRINLRIERSIVVAGITDEATVKRIRTLVRSELGDEIDMEDLETEVSDAMDAVQADVPSLFETVKDPGSGDGGKRSTKKTDAQIEKEQAAKYDAEYKKKFGTITVDA